MPYCRYCGTKMEDNQRYCMDCGTAAHGHTQSRRTPPASQPFTGFYGADRTESMDPDDIEKNKAVAGLAYFIFFLPLIVCPQSPYGKFHANQGLLVLLCCIVASIVGGVLGSISYLFSHAVTPWFINGLFGLIVWLVSLLVWLGVLALGLMGLINGFSGKAVELPFVGGITLIRP